MATTAGVGFSAHRNPAEAGRRAAADAMMHAGTEKPDLVIVFATVGYDQRALIRSIREATSGAPLSGCSGEGIITRDTVAETNFGVSVMALRSDELRFHSFFVTDIGRDISKAGKKLAADIGPHLAADNIACFLLADGLVFNFDPFLAAFQQTLGLERPLPLFGGLAADNWASKKTYQYHDDQVFSEGISCILMSGSGKVAWGVNHGCVPVGTERTITRCSGNVIYEIDGLPALEALKEYFDENWKNEWNKTSLNLCLGFKAPEQFRQHYDDYIIRYMMGKDDSDGHVKIQSEVSDGDRLWMVRRDKELILNGVRKISMMINEQMGGRKPKFVLHFECVGRGKVVLREQEKLEVIRSLQKDVGDGIPWMGFYTYGEIGPVSYCNSFHNFTSVVAAIY
ncbi:MAG TPA: FIST N-terminal domain-containing protein [Dissulfurispiraceae bacterium]|nr:FIST N-terminal domain-containing protein [Dissulfurispiraceae bacterium]